ncbi:hypothetical protein Vi05172_g11176 [Venturia inaequalis]|nr:hypothetical protein Vi05172_g11176 [Venturia inaequalis]
MKTISNPTFGNFTLTPDDVVASTKRTRKTGDHWTGVGPGRIASLALEWNDIESRTFAKLGSIAIFKSLPSSGVLLRSSLKPGLFIKSLPSTQESNTKAKKE